MDNNTKFDDNIKKLTEISDWFDSQEEVEVEKGLKKIKEAAGLIKESKKRLSEIENEFEEIKKDIEEELPTNDVPIVEEKRGRSVNPNDIPF